MASLARNRHGFLSIRFRAPLGGRSIQCCEGTKVRVQLVEGEWAPEDPTAYRQLLRWVDRITEEIDAGTFQYLAHFPDGNKARLFKPGGPMLFRTFAEGWLQDKAPPVLRAASYRDYRGIIDTTLNPICGDDLLFSIGEEERQKEIRRRLQAELVSRESSPPRMLYIFRLLRSILKSAKIDFEIPRFAGARRRRKLEYFPENEREILLLALPAFWRPFFTVAFFTGMRPSEQIALTEEDLDFTHKQIAIFRSLVEGVEGPTKTETSQRTIDMLPEAEAALLRFRTLREKMTVKTKYFFCTQRGAEIRPDAILTKIWYPAIEAAKLRRRVMYATRHTFASIHLSRGYDAAWVAHMMGDRLDTILKYYYNFIPRKTPMLNRSTQPQDPPI